MTNPMVSAVMRYEQADGARGAALAELFASFSILNQRILSVGGSYSRGTVVGVEDARSMRGKPWSVTKPDGVHADLFVDERCLGRIESERLRDDFGNVAYVVDLLGARDHRTEHALIVLTGMMEQR